MKKLLFTVLLSVIVVGTFTSCNTQKNSTKTKPVNSTSSLKSTQSQTVNTQQKSANPTDSNLLDLKDYELDKISFTFDNKTNDDFQDFIKNFNNEYRDSDTFNLSKALDKYNHMQVEPINSSSIINGNKINEDKLYQAVVKNNKDFLAVDKTNKYNNIDSSQLKNIVSIISQQINERLSNDKSIDTNILDNTLKNLKIFDSIISGNGCVESEDAKLCLNFIAIDSLQKNNPDVDMLERVIRHESNHLIQVGYPKNDEFKYNMGICYSYNDFEVNSLYWQWFIEGSAEKLTLENIQDLPFNYRDQVKGLEALSLATVADDNCNLCDIEKISTKKNLEELFDHFNADTDKEKDEILKMMFSYDIVLSDNKEYTEYRDFELTELYEYQDILKGNIGITLSKIFYSDLSDALVNQNVKIEDVYLLIRIFETELCRITDYDNTTKTEINKDFVNNYSVLQNEFFRKLSNVTGMSQQKTKDSFCAYSKNFCENAKYKNEDTYEINVNIDWLSKEKNEFLKYIATSRISHIYTNINS